MDTVECDGKSVGNREASKRACARWQVSLRTLFIFAPVVGLVALALAPLLNREAIRDELQEVASCFFDAVSVLQREPADGESLGTFFAEAKASGQSSRGRRFSCLRWDRSEEHIILSSGQVVRYRSAVTGRLRWQNHAESVEITYEFCAGVWGPRAKTTITLWFGQPPFAAPPSPAPAAASGSRRA
jgi:hypothetical protein